MAEKLKNEGSVCSLHVKNGARQGHITLFTNDTLQKCHEILAKRKNWNLKYSKVLLPKEIDKAHGFHRECYQKFTALSKVRRYEEDKPDEELINTEGKSKRVTRSDSRILPPKERTTLLPTVCLFCGQERKTVKRKEQRLINAETDNFEESVIKHARWKGDTNLIARIKECSSDLQLREVKYHAFCRLKYQSEARATPTALAEMGVDDHARESTASFWQLEKVVYSKAFDALVVYIEDTVIRDRQVHLMTDVNSHYQFLVHEIGGENFQDAAPSAQKLEMKLEKHFGDRITIRKGMTLRGNIIHSTTLTTEEALQKQRNRATDITVQIRNVALLLREAITKAKVRNLPENLTLEDVYKGETDVPEVLTEFFKLLIGGPDRRSWKQPSKQRRINSICQDVIYAATSGQKKPPKHLMTALALKSLTGSRKVIEMLNRLGHCVSYHTTEEMETELTFEAKRDNNSTPYGMALSAECGTGTAWDNFDRFVETQNGKDTLHDTVGIAYQISAVSPGSVPSTESEQLAAQSSTALPVVSSTHMTSTDSAPVSTQETSQASKSSSLCSPVDARDSSVPTKRRRAYQPSGLDIAPYRKKPKLVLSNLMPLDDPRRKKYEVMENTDSWKQDFLWMADTCLNEGIPMWVGWNSSMIPRSIQTHKIWYLPQLNQSPTSNAVVAETLRRSLTMAAECGKRSIAVTYDLAIAKIALQIQSQEQPALNNVFIALGSFHVELALFSAFGKVIEESGGPHLLSECNILAEGSVKSFIRGKNYKRCKRVHEFLALSMESLHLESFLKAQEDEHDICDTIRQELLIIKEKKNLNMHQFSPRMDEVFKQYDAYSKGTASGKNGKTAQFWFRYIEMIHLYHEYSRSIRVGNLEAYIACLPKIANYFYALNHPNYARWTVKYHDNLLRLPETHPEVYAEFKKGWFSIRRTAKPFSGSPIDLTLEQTINADAANQRTGIASLTNSISARQRWAESHFLRSSIISHIFEDLNMTKKEDVTESLKPHRVTKDNASVQKIVAMVKETMNPFDSELDPGHLFNIGTGKAASQDTEMFLLNVEEAGDESRRKFITECVEDPSRFEKRIQRQKLNTFATEAGKHKIRRADGKVMEACLVRDLFGSILYHSLQSKVDMAEVLKYPLTPVPLSLSHVDGSMQKSPKAMLLKYLESQVQTTPPTSVDTTIIDASFFLHLQMNSALPSSFGGVARYLLHRILSAGGDIIHFVSDKWLSPSIKDCERDSRSSSSVAYQITGPAQKRPSNWIQALRNSRFKEALMEFLVNSWEDDNLAHVFQKKTLFANSGDVCYSYRAIGGRVIRTVEAALCCDHEEADSRMFYHLANVPAPNNVVIRTCDTDCLVIALGCHKSLDPALKIWIEPGLQSNNSLRYISVNQLHTTLGETLCASLPAYHAFTGCDYTASFNRKGKVRPLKLLQSNHEAQTTFGQLGHEAEISEHTINGIEQYVCELYSKKKLSSVNEARLQMFLDKYKPKKGENRISCVKKLDGSGLPPCSKVLLQKIKRTHLVARRWLSSTEKQQSPLPPTEYGWTESTEGSYKVLWFTGDSSPKLDNVCCDKSIQESQEEERENESEGSDEESDSSSIMEDESSDEEDDDEDDDCRPSNLQQRPEFN